MVGSISRRTAMLSGAAVVGTAGLDNGALAATPLPEKVKLYARARGAPNGQLGMSWYSGRFWGKRAQQAAKLFFRVDGFSFGRMSFGDDGSLTQNMVEVGFWLDPQTGEPADDWINPYNGLACKPQHYKSSQSLTFDRNGNATRENPPPGMQFRGQITEPVVNGDYVWIGEDLIVETVRPRRDTNADGSAIDPSTILPPIMTATSLVTFTVRLADVAAPDSEWLPSTMNFQTMGNWYPWMRMGYETGQCMFQLQGRKVRGLEEIPPRLRKLIDERRPGFLENPEV
ncbi:MAG: DUF1838 family protein [Rhodobacteraceae bacterium]|nr:DUF1838 family protein [Paracoccaceae bacterium]